MSDSATIEATSANGPRRYEIRSGPERRREYSDAEKAAMVAETLSPDICIADVARRRGVHPQQLYTWRRQAKRGELALPADTTPMFAEVVTAPDPAALPATSAPAAAAAPGAAEVVIELGDLRLRIGPGVPPERAAALVAALRAAT
jgi:transposase